MKKLEDIPKKEVFNVPEGYFDELPGVIQARITADKPKEIRPVFSYALKYALPVVVLLVGAFFWFNRSEQPTDANSLLATIETKDLIAYLNDSDITTEEVLESVDLNKNEVDEIENEVYQLNFEDEDFQAIENEMDSSNN